jgi:hypothetical protein
MTRQLEMDFPADNENYEYTQRPTPADRLGAALRYATVFAAGLPPLETQERIRPAVWLPADDTPKNLTRNERYRRGVRCEQKSGGHPRKTAGVVYLVECIGFYKIGVTRNLSGRLRSLRNATGHEVWLLHKFFCATALEAEHFLHHRFDARRLGPAADPFATSRDQNLGRSEWFSLTREDVAWVRSLLTMVEVPAVENAFEVAPVLATNEKGAA